MKRVDIKTGFNCNNRCLFCVQAHKRALGNFTTKEVKDILKEARSDCDGVVFTGGEVTIRNDIFELVSYAKELNFAVIQMQTNGRMLAYEKFCKSLILAGANEFSPALHGHTAELHDYLTCAKGSFDQTVAGIVNLRRLGQKVLTNTVITKSNYRHLPEIAKLLVKLGVYQFQFAFVHAMGRAAENFDLVIPLMSMVEPYVKKGLDIGIKSGTRVMTEAIPYCFMSGYEDYIAEKIIPQTKIYDAQSIIDDFTVSRKTLGKVKGPFCKKCCYYKVCEGPWKEYPAKFGWKEFKPVLSKIS